MSSGSSEQLRLRVVQAAEAALKELNHVSWLDVMLGIGWLAPANVAYWRQGRVECLECEIQTNAKKVTAGMAMFRAWAEAKGLLAEEVSYTRSGRDGVTKLRYSQRGDLELERAFRTRFVSPALPKAQRKRLETKLDKPPRPLVYCNQRDSHCSACGAELPQGSFLYLDAGQCYCLPCGRLGDLAYLPAGDAGLTRKATLLSERTAVVLRFSRSRERYERQGILVEPEALKQATAAVPARPRPIAGNRERP